MLSVELFAGCGGLAFGIAEAGFEHALVIECDPQASATLNANRERRVRHIENWPLYRGDVRDVNYASLGGPIDLVSGGPPCQPFSIGGKHGGPDDARNMWPEAIRAVRELRPRAFLFENVRGLLRPAFKQYLEFLRLQLSWPEYRPTIAGDWESHLKKLSEHERSDAEPAYRVVLGGINAADYGSPQKRHRVIVMGVRSDVSSHIAFPAPTHSRESLVWSKWVTEDYWARHRVRERARPAITESEKWILKRLLAKGKRPTEAAWTTVRDAIGDLPRPSTTREPVSNHVLHPGARIYLGHTGSAWDEPAKALKAGDHGVPGGENVLVARNGRVRYFTIREMARLQGFPDEFVIDGSWKSPIKQLGNAVPVHIGRVFSQWIRRAIEPSMCSVPKEPRAGRRSCEVKDRGWALATIHGPAVMDRIRTEAPTTKQGDQA